MAISTWTFAQAKMSVKVNDTYFPFESTPDVMQRFVRPALFTTGHDVFELRYFGTALMGRYRNWRFAMATAHQMGDGDERPSFSSFVVVVEDNGALQAVPPSSAHLVNVEEERDRSLEDLILLDYNSSGTYGRISYLDLSSVYWSDSAEIATDYSFLIGYPSGSVDINMDTEDPSQLSKFVMRWVRQDLKPTRRQILEPENRNIFVKHEKSNRLSIRPDGLSGSPVFSIVHDQNKDRHLKFEGIITDAAGDRFGVYPSAFIRGILDSVTAS